MHWAKENRLSKLQIIPGYYCLLALDHPFTSGVVPGLNSISRWLQFTNDNALSGVIVNKGDVESLSKPFRKGLILQLMGLPKMKSEGRNRVLVGTIDDAIRAAADAVSLQVCFESEDLHVAIRDMSSVVSEAQALNVPVMFMINESRSSESPVHDCADKIEICAKLGADLIKTALPLKISQTLRRKLEVVTKYGPPILLAGGDKSPDFLSTFKMSLGIGFRGVCVGRNIFQSDSPAEILRLVNAAIMDRRKK